MFESAHETGWTPKLVGEQMIEAVRWAGYAVGPAGPAGIRSAMPAYRATWDDHMTEGWGLPEVAGDLEPNQRALYLNVSHEKVTFYTHALDWPADYLFPEFSGSARILALWVRCKVCRRSFGRAVDNRKHISRTHAYRMRDRALGVIATGLIRDGVPG